ncbi:MAG TPA: glycosyltransferase family 39 protein [Chloroflexia bacterium]|nr:glycosyltransferase family 39 protein [Chloroflexia bacterium]
MRSEAGGRVLWATRGIWLGALAWGVALAGLALLPTEGARNWTLPVELLAAALAVLAWAPLNETGVRPDAPDSRPLIIWDRARQLRLGGIGLAVVCAAGAQIAFLADPHPTFGLAGVLWLAGMGLLIGATARWPTRDLASPTAEVAPVAAGRLPVRRVGTALSASTSPTQSAPPAPAWPPWEIALLTGVLGLAVLLRVWDLQDIPFAIHPDEILIGQTAVDSYIEGPGAPIFSTLWERADLPALWFVGVAAALQAGGHTLAALRLQAALFGAALGLPLYGFVRGAWGRGAAIAATTIFAFSVVDIHYSRVTLNNIVTPFFWACCFFFLLRGWRGGRPLDWALAGIAVGLGEHGYYGNRLLPLLLIVFVGYLLLVHPARAWRAIGHFGLLVLGYVAAFGPLLTYLLAFRPELYFGRGAGMLTWDRVPLSGADLTAMWQTLWPLFAKNLRAFSLDPSVDGVYWSPFFVAGEAALLVLGVALLVRNWRQPAAFLLLLTGFGVLFVGGTLTRGTGVGPPFIAHWTAAMPAIYAAVGLPVGAWLARWQALEGSTWRRALGPGLVGAGLALTGILNAVFYDRAYVQDRPSSQTQTAIYRWAAALGPDYRVYSIGQSYPVYDPVTVGYLVAGQTGGVLRNPEADLPLPPAPGTGLAFLFGRAADVYQPLVTARYPGGTPGTLRSSDGKALVATYVLTPAQVAAAAERSVP